MNTFNSPEIPIIPPQDDAQVIDGIREILLKQEQEQLQILKKQIEAYKVQTQTEGKAFRKRTEDLLGEINRLQKQDQGNQKQLQDFKATLANLQQITSQLQQSIDSQAKTQQELVDSTSGELYQETERLQQATTTQQQHIQSLQTELEQLRQDAVLEKEAITAQVVSGLGDILGQAAQDSPQEVAQALGPILPEILDVGLRRNRQELIDSLSPVMGKAAQVAAKDFVSGIRYRPMTRKRVAGLVTAAVLALFILGFIFFSVRFAAALYPIAFGQATAAPQIAAVPEVSSESTPEATVATTDSQTDTPLGTPTVATQTSQDGIQARTKGTIWAHNRPEDSVGTRFTTIPINTSVTVVAAFAEWIEVIWIANSANLSGEQRGWIPLESITATDPIPESIVTPSP